MVAKIVTVGGKLFLRVMSYAIELESVQGVLCEKTMKDEDAAVLLIKSSWNRSGREQTTVGSMMHINDPEEAASLIQIFNGASGQSTEVQQ